MEISLPLMHPTCSTFILFIGLVVTTTCVSILCLYLGGPYVQRVQVIKQGKKQLSVYIFSAKSPGDFFLSFNAWTHLEMRIIYQDFAI